MQVKGNRRTLGRPDTVVGHYSFQVALPRHFRTLISLPFLTPKLFLTPFFSPFVGGGASKLGVVARWGEAFLVDADPALTLPPRANPALTPICPHVSPNVSPP